jgi:hypothetical protein
MQFTYICQAYFSKLFKTNMLYILILAGILTGRLIQVLILRISPSVHSLWGACQWDPPKGDHHDRSLFRLAMLPGDAGILWDGQWPKPRLISADTPDDLGYTEVGPHRPWQRPE